MFIPTFVRIEEDEYFPAWLSHLANLNGMTMIEFLDLYGNEKHIGYQENDLLKNRHIRNIDRFSQLDRFPTAKEILRYHTDYYITLPCYTKAEQAGKLAAMLYGDETYREDNRNMGKYKYCPLCAKEDLAKYGRIIAHTYHQLPAACCKHKIKLIEAPYEEVKPETASEEDLQFAQFIYDLYKDPVFTDIFALINIHGYKALNCHQRRQVYRPPFKTLSAIFNLYGTAQNFRNINSGSDPIYSATCQTCDKSYLQHTWLSGCPRCAIKNSISKRLNIHLQNHLPEYMTVTKSEEDMILAHNHCSKVTRKTAQQLLWDDLYCPKCEKSSLLYWENALQNPEYKPVGIKKKERTGYSIYLEHVGYNHTITVSGNSILKQNPIICKECIKEAALNKYIGMTKLNNHGEAMIIVAYRNTMDIDVLIGTRLCQHVSLHLFHRGVLQSSTPNENVRKKELGKRYYNKRYNMYMTVTKYIDRYHVEVTFEDGYIVNDCSIYDIRAGRCRRNDF